ncbi:hypothetical protein [Nitrospirillum viridazoti]|uniref:Uncharacterized protein n=2 Tax=Nitrospirillum TaxID=1543705 RepID=A0A248JNQ0_9PROT|nr:hypothetical protein [Nitrospirillum amazonense]ASG20373.1 hypothetical protein Y958_05755 [Nitrospirillum amazonense CBAmc]TWB34763.1 hypothetical protein FBZ91_11195 [Nitrospirillum amazonense]TWB47157.1 hypothetical protein FBZ92_13723 [Nitrospirillum amazonense]
MANPPTFTDVQTILFTITASQDDVQARYEIYGRHDAQGRYSWETERELLTSIANPYGGGQASSDTPLIPDLPYATMSDADITQKCALVRMLSPSADGKTPARMPVLSPATARRHATADELATIRDWLRTVPYPRGF